MPAVSGQWFVVSSSTDYGLLTTDSLKGQSQSNRISQLIPSRVRTKEKEQRMRTKTCLLACLLLLCTIATSLTEGQTPGSRGSRVNATKTVSANGPGSSDWPMYGRDLAGSHH